ncbi:MAG: FAD-dependent oxidoreductase [Pseudomonadota bacterium]
MSAESKIAIIGGGAGGLTTAWFLRKQGYKHVTVFERKDRIGGKCKSLTFDGRSFDLGANYITSSYTQVRRLAREFGMEMFTESKGHALDLDTGKLRSLFMATTRRYGIFHVGWAALRFLFIRFGIRKKLAPASPGFQAASDDPDLCGSFHDWLEKHGLRSLEPVFNIPITLMGYDKLRQVPAAYALTYMNTCTFLNLMFFAMNMPFRGWPKRFDLGYERLMERLAARVDVLRGSNITKIERGEKIVIHYERSATHLLGSSLDEHVEEFDALVLACPLLPEVLNEFMELSDEERALFEKVILDPFVVTTYATDCELDVSAVSFMFPRPEIGEPYVVTQQFRDVPLLSVYSRMDREGKITREDVLANNRKLLQVIGAEDATAEPYTYDEWPYFPHVDVEQMQSGFYRDLENQQGVNNTYYAGGLLAFELVETIAEYSRHLVKKHFGGNR